MKYFSTVRSSRWRAYRVLEGASTLTFDHSMRKNFKSDEEALRNDWRVVRIDMGEVMRLETSRLKAA